MLGSTAPAPVDADFPERARLHLAMRKELAEVKYSDYGQALVQLFDANVIAIPEDCFPAVKIPGEAAVRGCDQQALSLHDSAQSTAVEEALRDRQDAEEKAMFHVFGEEAVTIRGIHSPTNTCAPNTLAGRSWEKGRPAPGRTHSGESRDQFRERKPNTSRPPSAHVDEVAGTVPLVPASAAAMEAAIAAP